MKNDQLYLDNIKECIALIELYTASGKEAFFQTRMIQDAVIRNLEIIGEATKNLSPDFRLAHPEIPWRQMAGLRDVLIHDYLRIDLEEIWLVIETDLPDLKQKFSTIVDIL
jgi:uncharacterized protein with HEPN domain